MRTGRPIAPLSVTVEQRSTLENWVRRPKTAQALALRAKIILACAEGKPSGVVAHQVRVRQQTLPQAAAALCQRSFTSVGSCAWRVTTPRSASLSTF
jgi:hypothetical protein